MIEFIKRTARILNYTLENFGEVCQMAAEGSLVEDVEKHRDITITSITHFDYQHACPWDNRDTLDRMIERLDMDRTQVIDLSSYFERNELPDGQTDNDVAMAVAKTLGVELDED